MVSLSLITTVRGRHEHLRTLIAWLALIRTQERFTDFELIVTEGDLEPRHQASCAAFDWINYDFVLMSGSFHKSLLLNRASQLAKGKFLLLLDVDLLPCNGVLAAHLRIAESCTGCLIAGHRLQYPTMVLADSPLPKDRDLLQSLSLNDTTLLGPEDAATSILEYLIDGQRFGVCPCIPTERFRSIGGFDESYIGWGAEDQDLIERLCHSGLSLLRSYDLLYLHLPHDHEAEWTDPDLVRRNKAKFRQKRLSWVRPPNK